MKTAEGESFQTFRKILSSPVKFSKLYFEQSSIHGLAYFGKLSLTWIEKCLWITLVIICFAICTILGLQSLDRFNTKSVVVSLEKDHYYWNTSLPSLTICPLKRLSSEKFDKFCDDSNISNNNTRQDLWDFLESLANFSYYNFKDIRVSEEIKPLIDQILKPEDYMRLIYNLTDDLTRRTPEDLRVRTTENLDLIRTQQVLTEFGICYISNNFLGDHLSARYLIIGEHPGENDFDLRMKQKIHTVRFGNMFDGEISYNFIGFNVSMFMFIHSPYEVSRVGGAIGHAYTEDTISFDSTSIEILTTDDFKEKTRISQRNCRFIHESNLTHFSVYTKNLCMQECRIDFLYKNCKCIPHFYPNRIPNPKAVCSYKQLLECLPKYKDEIIYLRNVTDCYCLQNCEESKVIVERRQTMTGVKDLLRSVGGIVTVKKYPVVRFRRQILFTFTDLLVSIGGTAGFFLGFSVLGAVEVIYFFTLRYFWYLRGYK